MDVLSIYYLPPRSAFLLFILLSFVGWCSEVLYVGIFFEHKFVNRGFLMGPLCPIYGFGGVVILLLPNQLYSTWIPLFFSSLVLCTIVEYFASWGLEKMFHTLWWDYSHYKFHINGRVCLLNSFLFGLMGMLGGHFVFPYAEYIVTYPSDFAIRLISDIIAAILSADILFTIKRLVDFNTALERIQTFKETLRDRYEDEKWFRQESLSTMIISVKEHLEVKKDISTAKMIEKIEKLQDLRHKSIQKFINCFPTMQSIHYKEELLHIKNYLHRIRNKIEQEKIEK